MKRKTDLLMYPAVKLLVPLSLGIAVGDAVVDKVGPVWWWAMAVGMVVAASVMRHRKYIQSLLLLVAVFMTGAALVADRELSMQVKLPERIAGFNAVLLSEPVIHGKVVQTDLMVIRENGLLKVKASIFRDTLTNRYRSLHTGDGIEGMAYLEKPMNFSDATFDYARWLRLHGFSAETFLCPDQWRKKKVNLHPMSFFQRSLLTAAICRQKLMKKLADNLEGNALAVVTAMTLGDRHLLGKELKEDYSITGASHVLALSGLHLTVVYGLLMLLLGRVERLLPGLRRKGISELTVLFAVWSYVVLVGMSSSVVRSAMMLTIYSFVSLLNRDRLSVNTLALTAVIMLFCNPLSLFDIGFQLSFVSVWSILLFYPLLYQTLSSRYLKHCAAGRWLWGMTAVSVAAQLGTAPLIVFYFCRFSTVFIPGSLIAVPGTMMIIWSSVFMLILSPFPVLSSFFGQMAGQLVYCQDTALHWLASFPWASIGNLHVTLLQLAVYYAMLMGVWLLWSFLAEKTDFR